MRGLASRGCRKTGGAALGAGHRTAATRQGRAVRNRLLRVSGALLLALLSTFMHLGRAAAAEHESGTPVPWIPEVPVQEDRSAAPVSSDVSPSGVTEAAIPAPAPREDAPANGTPGAPAEPTPQPDPPEEAMLEAQPTEEPLPDGQPSTEPTQESQPTETAIPETQPTTEPTDPALDGDPSAEAIVAPQPSPEPSAPVIEAQLPEPTEPIADGQPPAEPVATTPAPEVTKESSAASSATASAETGHRAEAQPPSATTMHAPPQASVASPPPAPLAGTVVVARPVPSESSIGEARMRDGAGGPAAVDRHLQFEQSAIAVSASVAAFAAPRVPTQVTVAIVFGKAGSGWAGAVIFNVWLRRQLRERRISQRQLAHMSGVDHSTISRLIGGARTPSLETATKIARALRVPEEEIGRELGFARGRPPLPLQRVESALRGDDELDESDIRALMDAYLARRRRHQLRAVGTDGASLRPPVESRADSPA
jgi:transcriptional regulator with XRE-family HTH domain